MIDAFIGEMRMLAGHYVPKGWALCDGTLLSINEYPALYSLLGYTYGGKVGSQFALPNYCGVVPVGQGRGLGLTPRVLAETFGETSVVMKPENTASHTHHFVVSTTDASSPYPMEDPGKMTFGEFQGAGIISGLYSDGVKTLPTVLMNENFLGPAVSSIGKLNTVATPHSNMMGSLAINYIICLTGLYPTQGESVT